MRNEKSYDGLGGGRTKRLVRTTLSSIPANEGRPALLVCSSENHEISPSASTPTRHVYPEPWLFLHHEIPKQPVWARGEILCRRHQLPLRSYFSGIKKKVRTTVEKTRHMRALHRPLTMSSMDLRERAHQEQQPSTLMMRQSTLTHTT